MRLQVELIGDQCQVTAMDRAIQSLCRPKRSQSLSMASPPRSLTAMKG